MNISAILLRTSDQRQASFELTLLVRGLIHALGLSIFFPNLNAAIIHAIIHDL